MATYQVTITNGAGSENMKAGTYAVTAASAPGYDLSSLSPATFTATAEAGTQAFTLTAEGTLTFIVNETGASGGTPITGGTIVMTDSAGTVEYGSPVTIDSNGNAVFNNVPYGDGTSPITLYFKQLTTDAGHNVHQGVVTVSMTAQTQTEYLQNTAIALQSFTLTDANYSGLPVDSASLSFSND